jgi:hypothetical protein
LISSAATSGHDVFSRPYLNVMRMHFLIIFFGVCHALKVDSFPTYVLVYAVYFFPWSAFRKADDTPAAALTPALSKGLSASPKS